MVKILKIVYIVLTVAGMAITSSNTFILKEIGHKIDNIKRPTVTSTSQINIK
ncbi:MAG: hypothetical protein ACRC0G_10935 [Fusobacteriaceae bacterium]